MGQCLLKKNTGFTEEEDGDVLQSYDRLREDEVKKLQLKLARSLVVFMELIHLMIARNRDLLLDVIQERKKGESGGHHHHRLSTKSEIAPGTVNSDARSHRSIPPRQGSTGAHDSSSSQDDRSREETPSRTPGRNKGFSGMAGTGGDEYTLSESDRQRTEKNAIAIQSELQRAFITLSKDLHPMIYGIMRNETPVWLKKCCQESYFSSYAYRNAKICKSLSTHLMPQKLCIHPFLFA